MLLRDLLAGDSDSAQALGCLELDEEDLALMLKPLAITKNGCWIRLQRQRQAGAQRRERIPLLAKQRRVV
jgi:hypothetical protein